MKVLGAHIIGSYASVLIHEIVNLMYIPERNAALAIYGGHIHPALSEVVEGAFHSLVPPQQFHRTIEHHYEHPLK